MSIDDFEQITCLRSVAASQSQPDRAERPSARVLPLNSASSCRFGAGGARKIAETCVRAPRGESRNRLFRVQRREFFTTRIAEASCLQQTVVFSW